MRKDLFVSKGVCWTPSNSAEVCSIKVYAESPGEGRVNIVGDISESVIQSIQAAIRLTASLGDIDENCFKHLNIKVSLPSPLAGDSMGLAILVALYCAIKKRPVSLGTCITGAISEDGSVRHVLGVREKVAAAKKAGLKKMIIPYENWSEVDMQEGVKIHPVKNLVETFLALDL